MEIKGKYNTAKVMTEDIDAATYSQIQSLCNVEHFKDVPIKVMPDCHLGKGSVIGFTCPIGKRVCPNVISVDIGCGVLSVNIGKHIPLTLKDTDILIRKYVPLGFKSKEKETNVNMGTYGQIDLICKKINKLETSNVLKQIGTLGGGNHFIELGKDETGDYWLTVHSGSRRFGKEVCDYWQKIAIETDKTQTCKELAFLSEEDSSDYLYDMSIAQEYADLNRVEMINIMLKEVFDFKVVHETERISSVHNFMDFRDGIIRKGAIRSYVGEKMVIPFNMKDGLLICEGKSNPDWNNSAPHGAGRLYSRAKAKRELSLEEFQTQMKDANVYSTSISQSTLDEAPNAYKDAKVIEDAIEPTATILRRVKPVLNIKA